MPHREIMHSLRGSVLPLALWLLCLFTITASPTILVELESTYLGDGWFQYRVKLLQDPFFDQQALLDVGPTSFTNLTETGPVPVDWMFMPPDQPIAMWGYTNTLAAQTFPYEKVFWVRSSQRDVKQSAGFLIVMSLRQPSWMHPPYSGDVAAFIRLPCLVPCPPAEADGSPTNLLTSYEPFPDVHISGLSPSTISYEWAADCTVLIQDSSTLTAWTNVAYAFGCLGTTTWTSSVSFSASMSFFRVGLVSMRRETNWVNP
jgi:hypothetical protein